MRSVLVIVLAICALVAANDVSARLRARVSALEQHVRTEGKFPVGEFPVGPGERCNCAQDICNCCAERTPKPGPVCLDLTFDPNAQTLLVELTVNGQVVWSETKSDNKPLSKCIVKECDICVHLHNLNISRGGACGEVTFNITCPKIPVQPEKTKQFHTGGECTIPTFGRHHQGSSSSSAGAAAAAAADDNDASASNSDSDSNNDSDKASSSSHDGKKHKHHHGNKKDHSAESSSKEAETGAAARKEGPSAEANSKPLGRSVLRRAKVANF